MSKRKLLLADDSVTIQKVVNLTFADEGIEVITAGDGNAAMEKLRETEPDLVMADVNMPGLNGYQICERIKHDEATRATPVILLVGSFEPFDKEKAAAVGADDYLTKPFQSIRQLVSKVTELLSNEESNERPAFMEDTLEMDRNISAADKSEFDDGGFDDDMIQTNHIDNYSSFDMPGFSGQTNAGKSFEPEESYNAQTEENLSDDQFSENQFSNDQYETTEPHFSETAKDANKQGYYMDDFQKSYSEVHDEPQTEDEKSIEQPESISDNEDEYFASEDAPERFEETENYFANQKEERFQQDDYPEENSQSQMEYKSDAAEEIPQPVAPSVLEFDEFDLLELPPIDFGDEETQEAIEEETAENEDSQPSVQEPQNEEPQIREAEEAAPVQAIEDDQEEVKTEVARQFSSVDFPPEVIEAIAERVVEKLSQKLKE